MSKERMFNATDDKMEANMLNTLETWLANPLLTLEEVGDKAGIGRTAFWRYRQNPLFMEEYRRRQRERFAAMEGKAIELLNNELDKGNWNAIKYTLDGLGYKPTDKVEITEKTIKVDIDED